MTAVLQNIVVEPEATFRLTTYWGTLQEVGGVQTVVAPFFDWTGASARMQIRQGPGKPVLLEVTDVASTFGQVIFGANGALTLKLHDEGTKTLAVKKAEYDVLVTYASGEKDRLLKGDVKIDPAITQDPP